MQDIWRTKKKMGKESGNHSLDIGYCASQKNIFIDINYTVFVQPPGNTITGFNQGRCT